MDSSIASAQRISEPLLAPGGAAEDVRLIHRRDDVRRLMIEMDARSRPQEVLNVTRAGAGIQVGGEAAYVDYLKSLLPEQLDHLAHGSRCRTVLGTAAFSAGRSVQEYFDPLREAGEVIRSVPGRPGSLVIIDRSYAYVAVGNDGGAAFIQNPLLVDSYVRLFMTIWESARPEPVVRAPLAPLDAAVLDLLANGATDSQIARILHVGERTVRRRVAEMMASVSAQSRFQLGQRAADVCLPEVPRRACGRA